MKLAVLLIALGIATTAFADDYDSCLARRHMLEAQLRESPPGTQVALEKELPVCRIPTPPLSGGRVAGEVLLGAAAGVGGGFVGLLIGAHFNPSDCGDFCRVEGA